MGLLERLEVLANLKTGEPAPDWLAPNAWGPAVSQLCREAATEIKHLRQLAGTVTQGPSLDTIKRAIDRGDVAHAMFQEHQQAIGAKPQS